MRQTFQLSKPQGALSLATEIQFGIEIEFLTPPVSLSQTSRCIPDRDRIFHYFATALQRSGLQAAFLLDKDYPGNSGESSDNNDQGETETQFYVKARRGSIIKTKNNPDMYIMNPLSSAQWLKDGAEQNPLFRYWLIKAESDINGHGKHAAWQPTELNSPILRESEANNLFPGINTALHTIWTAHPAKVHVNDSCGLHIHVSPASPEGLTVLQVQRVATLVMVLENNLLFHLCSPIRRRVHHQLTKASALAYAKAGPASSTAAAANLPSNIFQNGSMNKAMNLLWSASDLDQVRQMLSRHTKIRDAKFTALHVNTQTHEDDSHTNSLEFRHAQASFNQSFVDNWVCLILTICKVAFLPAERYKLVVAML
jgi:hypothetical protein